MDEEERKNAKRREYYERENAKRRERYANDDEYREAEERASEPGGPMMPNIAKGRLRSNENDTPMMKKFAQDTKQARVRPNLSKNTA
jgi:hypothetical protein